MFLNYRKCLIGINTHDDVGQESEPWIILPTLKSIIEGTGSPASPPPAGWTDTFSFLPAAGAATVNSFGTFSFFSFFPVVDTDWAEVWTGFSAVGVA